MSDQDNISPLPKGDIRFQIQVWTGEDGEVELCRGKHV